MANLVVRRLIQKAEADFIPSFKDDVKGFIDIDLSVSIDWPSFKEDENRIGSIWGCGLDPIRQGLSEICVDDLGKQAVKEHIKEVKLVNVDTTDQSGIDLKDGVLTVRTKCDNDGYFGSSQLRDALLTLL